MLLALTRNSKEDGNGALAHFGLGRTYNAQGNYAQAVPHLKIAAERATEALARYMAKESSEDDARILALANAFFALPLADAYYQTGQSERAKELFETTTDIGRFFPILLLPVLVESGQIDIEQGNTKSAQAKFQRTLAVLEAYDIDGQKIRPYLERRVAALKNVTASASGKGAQNKLNAGATANLQRDPTIDAKMSEAIRLFMDKLFIDKALMSTLGE